MLILIIQQTLLLGIGLSAGTARENNRFKDLVPISRQYQGTLRIVGGKSLAYFLIYALVAAYVLCLVPQLFDLVQNCTAYDPVSFCGALTSLACIFFCDDLLHLYTSQTNMSDDLCLHLRTAPVYLRNLLAGELPYLRSGKYSPWIFPSRLVSTGL